MATDADYDNDIIKKRARVLIMTRAFVAIAVIYAFVLLSFVSLNAFQAFQTRSTIVDCVKTTGTCYQRGQDNMAEVVAQLLDAGQINEATTRLTIQFSILCSNREGVDTFQEIEACVKEQFALTGNNN